MYYAVIIFFTTSLASCYYYPDLRGQTLGSGAGAVVGGVVATAVTSDLIALGSGIIVTSIIGGSMGQGLDMYSPLRIEDPIESPAPLFFYTTLRAPLVPQCFYPAVIITEETTLADIAAIRPPCRAKVCYG